MNKVNYAIALGLLVLYSCDSSTHAKGGNKADSTTITEVKKTEVRSDTTKINSSITASEETVVKEAFSKTIKIPYHLNRNIMEVLPLLPDSTMGSWGWTKKEREDFIQMVKAKDYFIDTTANYNNIQQVKPHYFLTQVVDGSWSVALYKIGENHFIVITNDMVGDGNDIKAFDWQNDQLSAVHMEDLIGKNYGEWLLSEPTDACKNLLEENEMFAYHTEVLNHLTISSSTLNKTKYEACCKGNTLYFVFNPKSKKFDLDKIKWE